MKFDIEIENHGKSLIPAEFLLNFLSFNWYGENRNIKRGSFLYSAKSGFNIRLFKNQNQKKNNQKRLKIQPRSKTHEKSCQPQKFEKFDANRVGIFIFGPSNKKVFLPTLVEPRLGMPRHG